MLFPPNFVCKLHCDSLQPTFTVSTCAKLRYPAMTRPKIRVVDTGEMPFEERLQAAVKVYKARYNSQREISIRKVALNHGVPWETVRDRISGSAPRKKTSQDMQRLSPF